MTRDKRSQPPLPRDHELVRRLRDGDAAAFETLHDRHAGFGLAMALRLLGNREAADGILHEVFEQLWDGKVRYDERHGRFTTWFFVLVRRRSLDRLRAEGRRPEAAQIEDDPDRGERGPEIDAYTYERIDGVRRALGVLASDQRNAFEVCFFEGLTHGQAAKRLDQSSDTVKSRIKSGLDKLRAALRELNKGLA